jgi:hypothetical protein
VIVIALSTTTGSAEFFAEHISSSAGTEFISVIASDGPFSALPTALAKFVATGVDMIRAVTSCASEVPGNIDPATPSETNVREIRRPCTRSFAGARFSLPDPLVIAFTFPDLRRREHGELRYCRSMNKALVIRAGLSIFLVLCAKFRRGTLTNHLLRKPSLRLKLHSGIAMSLKSKTKIVCDLVRLMQETKRPRRPFPPELRHSPV